MKTLLILSFIILALGSVRGAIPFVEEDWTALTNGLNGQSLSIGLGTPDIFRLVGTAFPVIVSQNGNEAMVAAARVTNGRLVAFNKEAYMQQCGNEPSPTTALPCRLAVNALRWASAVPAPDATTGTAAPIRVAVRGAVNSAQLEKIRTAAASLGFNITQPSGYTTFFFNDLQWLGSGASRKADVVLTTSYINMGIPEMTAVQNFVTSGGGLVIGGQAWSTGGDITQYNGNKLVSPFNCVFWTGAYGDARSITVATSMPNPLLFNADLAAQAVLDHMDGTAVLTTDALSKVGTSISNSIRSTSFRLAIPATSPSAALWASFGSLLDSRLSNYAASWNCGQVPAGDVLNQITVAYMAKRQTDMDPTKMTAFPCYAKFPGVPAAGAEIVASATVTVNATYAGNYTGPMPPRGGTKRLSTGMWAPAGQVITVTISPAVAATLTSTGGSLGVMIGSHSDNLAAKTTWCRLPYGMVQTFWFTSAAGGNVITAASGVGGLIYIAIKFGNAYGTLGATITGAVRAPFFFKGQTSEEEWKASIRNYPAPWAEIGSDKFVMTVPSSAVVNLDNPQAVADTWDTVLDGYADLTTFTRDRPRAERVTLDCDISAGWMHSGYPIMAYVSVASNMMLPNLIGRDNGWGFFHELGHNHQWSAWTLPRTSEATNNLYSVWAMENIMKMNRTKRMTNRAAEQTNYFTTGSFDPNFETTTALYMIMQMQENFGTPGSYNSTSSYNSGWEFFSRFLQRMQLVEGTAAVANDAGKIKTWIVESSFAAGKNLINFYRAWKFPITAEAEAAVAALPPLDFDPTAPCTTCTDCCLPGSMSPSISDICKQPLPDGWQFYSGKDSSGNDLGNCGVRDDWVKLAAACSAKAGCIAVNTNGWMKKALKPQANWGTWTSDTCKGMLVKIVPSP